jgi:hypothetical protein
VVRVGILLMAGIILFSVLFGFSIIGQSYPSLVSLLVLLDTTGIGLIATCLHVLKKPKNESVYGIRGISRTLLSRAIFYLDMMENGYIEVGKIKGPSVPQEVANTTGAHGAAIYALNRIDKGLAKTWRTTLKEKLAPGVSWRTTWLAKITIFGPAMVFPVIGVVFIFVALGVLSTPIAFQIMWLAFGVFWVLLTALFLKLVRSSHHPDVPEGVLAAVAEPQVKFDTKQALERLVEVYKEEGQYPLRVLVLDDNNAFTYTDRTYETTKGYKLRAAALFPNQTTSNLTDDQ